MKVVVSRQQRRAHERARRKSELADAVRAERLEQKLSSPRGMQQRKELGNTILGVALLLVSVAAPPIAGVAQGLLRLARGARDWLKSRPSRR